jgi:hypothetical protein
MRDAPITEEEIRYALFVGACESQAAQGNHAWSSLLGQRDAAIAELARIKLTETEKEALVQLSNYMQHDGSYPMKEWEQIALRAIAKVTG